jgi:hypothetical protein
MTRCTCARFGTSMPASFSQAMQYGTSLQKPEIQSRRLKSAVFCSGVRCSASFSNARCM